MRLCHLKVWHSLCFFSGNAVVFFCRPFLSDFYQVVIGNKLYIVYVWDLK